MRKFFWMAFAGAHVLEVESEKAGPRWGIEFRNGGWFQGLTMKYSGPSQHAHKFNTKEEAEDMLKAHAWLMFAGGMVKEIK